MPALEWSSRDAYFYSGTRDGVFKSTDRGGTWSPANTGLPYTSTLFGVGVLAIDPTTPSRLYAGTVGSGVFDIEQVSSGSCVGDCTGHHQVTVEEILTMVNIGLGNAAISDCRAGDANQNSQITVDEILAAVNNALNGCPIP